MRWSDLVAGRPGTHPLAGTTKAAAAIRALEIPELCEHILGFLPAKDVLLAHRVCRKIQTIIAGSSKLQVRHFSQARVDCNSSKWYFSYDSAASSYTWPIGVVGREKDRLLKEAANTGIELPQVTPVIANPLILHMVSCTTVRDHVHIQLNPPQYHYCYGTFNLIDSTSRISERPKDASCRTMFLTQPPQKTASVTTIHTRTVIANSKGLIFQDLLDVIGDGEGLNWCSIHFEDAYVIDENIKNAYERELEETLREQGG